PSARPHFLSTTYPGEAHSYTNWDEYLNEYRGSHFALSTKKGGWDTFRHLEVLFAGAIPLMPGLASSPNFSLAHYPKTTLSAILRSLISEGPAVPDDATHDFLSRWAHQHLTTKSMAEFLLEMSNIQGNVVFLDRALQARTDYLSAFTFIGLSQVLGSSLRAAWEPSYLFDDFEGDTLRLYGKGFGYTRSIPAHLKSDSTLTESASLKDVLSFFRSADSIVVGNYDANRDLVAHLLDSGIPANRFTCVLGSDLPPDYSLMRGIAKSGMTFFVREFAR
ncbi:MAG: Only Syngen Nebraska virus 5, partial [Actinomycetota bacterium]